MTGRRAPERGSAGTRAANPLRHAVWSSPSSASSAASRLSTSASSDRILHPGRSARRSGSDAPARTRGQRPTREPASAPGRSCGHQPIARPASRTRCTACRCVLREAGKPAQRNFARRRQRSHAARSSLGCARLRMRRDKPTHPPGRCRIACARCQRDHPSPRCVSRRASGCATPAAAADQRPALGVTGRPRDDQRLLPHATLAAISVRDAGHAR